MPIFWKPTTIYCLLLLKRGPMAVAALLLAGMQVSALAQDGESNLGRLMWSAFECATYAALSGNEDEQARLFKVGYNAGKEFLTGIENGTIPEAERRKAPVVVLLLVEGPSIDFMIGRIFENAAGHAHDGVVAKGNNGVRLDPSKWIADDELIALIASNKYHTSNCELIQ